MSSADSASPSPVRPALAATASAAIPKGRARGPLWYAWRRLIANRAALVGGGTLLLIAILALIAPLIFPTGPTDQAYLTEALAFPSLKHWFGIDDLGRDFLTRIVHGARVSLSIGFIAAIFAVLIGIPLGAAAGYYGGAVDWFIMRLIEIFSVVPPLLAAMLPALAGGGFWMIVFIAALFGWVQVCLPSERRSKPSKRRSLSAQRSRLARVLLTFCAGTDPQLSIADYRWLCAGHSSGDDA